MRTTTVRNLIDSQIELTLQEEILRGLAGQPKRISPKFFYDEKGSQLFQAICLLPEYYLTRTEMTILRSCAPEIATLAGPGCMLIEPGGGAADKVRLLLDALRPRQYLGIDISREFLLRATEQLAQDCPWLEVHAVCADFTRNLELPDDASGARRIVFFPGSTIGNFEPQEALDFLRHVRRLVRAEGALIIGVDLKKSPEILNRAYNDSAGVTAAFNLNLLHRLRDEFGASFDIEGFEHHAFYNATRGRIEMHLRSRREQQASLLGRRLHFAEGESIHTENSYKYGVAEFQALARRAGFEPLRVWLDPQHLFSVHYLS